LRRSESLVRPTGPATVVVGGRRKHDFELFRELPVLVTVAPEGFVA